MELKTVLESVEAAVLLDIVKGLIRIPGHSDSPGQEREVSEAVIELLRSWGFEPFVQKVNKERYNVIAKIDGNSGGRSLVFNGHLDTVPPGEGMNDPYIPAVRGDRLYGRGSSDMKGAVGAMLYVLLLLKKYDIHLGGDLYFTGVVGEETGGIGTRFLTESGFRADFAVVGEPTELNLVTSHKGVLQLEITIRGKSAHASVPEQGVNAISAMSDFIQRIKEDLAPKLKNRIQKQAGVATLNFGKIRGGTKANMVADSCSLQVDRRWVKGENPVQAMAEIKSILSEVCGKDTALNGELVSIIPRDAYFGPFEISEDHELVKKAVCALECVGLAPKITGMQGWTDAATLMKVSIPTVLFGPGSIEQAHVNEEYIEIAQLLKAVRCYLSLTREICGWE